MALPFKVFSNEHANIDGVSCIWCLRCQAWIPYEVAYRGVGAAFDPHISDHLDVWLTFQHMERVK